MMQVFGKNAEVPKSSFVFFSALTTVCSSQNIHSALMKTEE